MKLNLEITSDTTPRQLRALAKLFHDLAGDKAVAFSGPSPEVTCGTTSTSTPEVTCDTTSTSTPEVTVSTTSTSTSETDQAKPTRRRRTKAEIEADEAAVAAMTETTSQKADGGAEPGEVEEKIDHGTGEVTTIAGAEGKPYTEGEVQALATLIARSKGPDVVRNKITELGGTRISALTADQINALGAFLESQK